MAEYDIIQARDQIHTLKSGETFENKLIDMRNGRGFTISTWEATNWTIRNVGFIGTHRKDMHAIVAADHGGGTSRIENVYLGDGCVRPATYRSHGQCGLFVHQRHKGTLNIENVNVQGWPNNGMYANGPYNGGNGAVRINNCYAADNYVSNFRIGSTGSRLVNSVGVNTGKGRYTGRPLWAWGKTVGVSGCRLKRGPYPNGAIHIRDSTRVNIDNTTHDGYYRREGSAASYVSEGANVKQTSSMDTSIPDGVPLAATAAAAGQVKPPADEPPAPVGDHPDKTHILEIEASGDGPVDYFFEVESGGIVRSSVNGAVIDKTLSQISGQRAAGRVPAGTRAAFEFDALLRDLDVRGDNATVLVDGTPSNLSRYPREGAAGDDWKSGFPWQEAPPPGDGVVLGDETAAMVAELVRERDAARERVAALEAELAAARTQADAAVADRERLENEMKQWEDERSVWASMRDTISDYLTRTAPPEE